MRLIYISGAFVLGVFLGSWIEPSSLPFLITGGVLVLPLVFFRNRRVVLFLVMAVFLMLGLGRGAASAPDPKEASLSQYHEREEVRLQGLIVGYPEPREALSQFRFRVSAVDSDGGSEKVSGTVLVRARPSPELVELREPPYFRYGDTLRLAGQLQEPPSFEEFDWRDHLAREGIHFLMIRPQVTFLESSGGTGPLAWIYEVRTDMARSLGKALPEPQASLSHAMLLGLRSTLPSELREDLARTGTTHLIAISGLHVGIIVGLVGAFSLRLFGRRNHMYILVPLISIWAYALLSGLAPPVFRAAIMGSMYLWALYLGRQKSAIVPLAAAAAVMIAIDVDALEDVSFQLSFLAMTGLIFLAPWFQAGGNLLVAKVWGVEGWSRSLALLVSDGIAISLAAILATLPVIAFNFHMIPLVGVPATLFALPALPPILVTSLLVALTGLFAPALAQGLAWLAWPWLTYMVGVVEFFSWVSPISVDAGSAGVPLAWAYYGLAALILWVANRRWGAFLSRSDSSTIAMGRPDVASGIPKLLSWRWGIAFLTIPPLVFLSIALSQPSDRLRVIFLDVGQGDSILVQTPSQRNVLIDGGSAPGTLALELGQRLPFWDRTLDLVVLTHPDDDHLTGLAGLSGRYEFRQVLECGVDCMTVSNEEGYLIWGNILDREGIAALDAEAGQAIDLKGGAELTVLHPPSEPLAGTQADANNNSVVLRLTYGQVSFLFPADIEGFAERYLVRRGEGLDATVLKVAHHGSGTSTTPEFLDAVTPVFVVVSVGADNPYGHPHPQTLAILMERLPEEQVLLTSERGTIQFETDGRHLWLTTDR